MMISRADPVLVEHIFLIFDLSILPLSATVSMTVGQCGKTDGSKDVLSSIVIPCGRGKTSCRW